MAFWLDVKIKHFALFGLACIITYLFSKHTEYEMMPIFFLKLPPNVKECTRHVYLISSDSSVDITCRSADDTLSLYSMKLHDLLEIRHHFLDPSQRATVLRSISTPNNIENFSNEIILVVSGSYLDNKVYTTMSASKSSELELTVKLLDAKFSATWTQLIPINWTTFNSDELKSHMFNLMICDTCQVTRDLIGLILIGFQPNKSHKHQYSTFVLSLKDGHIVWQRQFGDNEVNKEDTKQTTPIHRRWTNWKLELVEQLHKSPSQADWREYRETFSQILPINWQGDQRYPSFQLVSLRRRRYDEQIKSRSVKDGLACIHSQGIDLVELQSGRLLTSLAIEWNSGSTYDLLPSPTASDSDHQVWRLTKLHLSSSLIPTSKVLTGLRPRNNRESGNGREQDVESTDRQAVSFSTTVDCYAEIDPVESSFDVESTSSHTIGGLCRPLAYFDYPRLGQSSLLEDSKRTVPPITWERPLLATPSSLALSVLVPKPTSLSYHEHDHNPHHHPDTVDMIFLTSDGIVTSLSPDGQENWRTSAEVGWLQYSRAFAGDSTSSQWGALPSSDDPFLAKLYLDKFQPSLVKAADFHALHFTDDLATNWIDYRGLAKVSSPQPILIATGWDSLSFINPSTGELLASHRLPSHPIGPPIVLKLCGSSLDNNNNGSSASEWIDSLVLLPCDGLFIGFVLTYSVKVSALILTTVSIFTGFLLLAVCYSIQSDYFVD